MCPRRKRRGCGLLAKAQATARVDVPTAPRVSFFVILNSFMSVLPIHETQKSQSGERKTVVRQIGFRVKHDVTVWDLEPSPARSTSLCSLYLACVCVFFEHGLVGFCPIEHEHAAHQDLSWDRNVPCSIYGRGHVVLPPAVTSSVASSLFFLAGA